MHTKWQWAACCPSRQHRDERPAGVVVSDIPSCALRTGNQAQAWPACNPEQETSSDGWQPAVDHSDRRRARATKAATVAPQGSSTHLAQGKQRRTPPSGSTGLCCCHRWSAGNIHQAGERGMWCATVCVSMSVVLMLTASCRQVIARQDTGFCCLCVEATGMLLRRRHSACGTLAKAGLRQYWALPAVHEHGMNGKGALQ